MKTRGRSKIALLGIFLCWICSAAEEGSALPRSPQANSPDNPANFLASTETKVTDSQGNIIPVSFTITSQQTPEPPAALAETIQKLQEKVLETSKPPSQSQSANSPAHPSVVNLLLMEAAENPGTFPADLVKAAGPEGVLTIPGQPGWLKRGLNELKQAYKPPGASGYAWGLIMVSIRGVLAYHFWVASPGVSPEIAIAFTVYYAGIQAVLGLPYGATSDHLLRKDYTESRRFAPLAGTTEPGQRALEAKVSNLTYFSRRFAYNMLESFLIGLFASAPQFDRIGTTLPNNLMNGIIAGPMDSLLALTRENVFINKGDYTRGQNRWNNNFFSFLSFCFIVPLKFAISTGTSKTLFPIDLNYIHLGTWHVSNATVSLLATYAVAIGALTLAPHATKSFLSLPYQLFNFYLGYFKQTIEDVPVFKATHYSIATHCRRLLE